MSKRIFTKQFHEAATTVPAVISVFEALAIWRPQEDIEIIGWYMSAWIQDLLANDGNITWVAELSQVGVLNQDGVIGCVTCTGTQNTAPNFGDLGYETLGLIFPAGFAIPIREEGAVYMNCEILATDLAVGTPVCNVHGAVYYTK